MTNCYLIDASTWYKGLPHQDEAWKWLENDLTPAQLTEFQNRFREDPQFPVLTPQVVMTQQLFQDLTGYKASLFPLEEVDDCNKMLRDTGFAYDKDAFCMLFGNILHETANLKYMEEIADGSAYEGRADLGNTSPGDGKLYKGAGVLMLTGKFNYQQFADGSGNADVMEGYATVAKQYPYTSATNWILNNDLLNVAQKETFDDVCYRINGGFNGIEDRWYKYRICQDVIL